MNEILQGIYGKCESDKWPKFDDDSNVQVPKNMTWNKNRSGEIGVEIYAGSLKPRKYETKGTFP